MSVHNLKGWNSNSIESTSVLADGSCFESEEIFTRHYKQMNKLVDRSARWRLSMDQLDWRDNQRELATWLAHREPMGKRQPGTQINGFSPFPLT